MANYYERLVRNLPGKPFLLGRDNKNKSAVFVPFAEVAGKEYIIFEKRAKGIRQEGEICFPGGMVDHRTDTTSELTALRETEEELGIPAEKISIEKHVGYFTANIGTTIDIFAGRIDIKNFSELNPNKSEVEAVCPVPSEFFISAVPERYLLETEIKPEVVDENGNRKILLPARELGLPEKYHSPWVARKSAIYLYRYNDIIIWGLTAAIIREIAGFMIKEDKIGQ